MNKGLDIRAHLESGWALFSRNIQDMIVAGLVFLVIYAAASFTWFGVLLIAGPMTGGLFLFILDARGGADLNVMRLVDGFKLFVPLVLVGIAVSIFQFVGFLFFIIPSVIVSGWYLFSYLLVVEKNLEFWPAMEASRKYGFEHQLDVFLLALAIMVVNLAGLIPFGLGLLVTLPYSACVITEAYVTAFGLQDVDRLEPPTSSPPPPPPPVMPS